MFEALTLAVALLGASVARADFAVPPLTGPVVDDAGLLGPSAQQAIAAYLSQLRQAGGSQITVLTLPDLGGVAIEEASIKIFDAWKLGGAKTDDGVLLLIAAKERKMRIEVGRGREGELPDVVASRIIREVIAPRMRSGTMDRAVVAGVRAIAQRTDPQLADQVAAELSAGEFQRPRHRAPGLLQLIFLLVLLAMLLRGGGGFWGGFGGGLGGGWGGGGFGGGFGGGSDGGGWSGGGGDSSGGGASGGW